MGVPYTQMPNVSTEDSSQQKKELLFHTAERTCMTLSRQQHASFDATAALQRRFGNENISAASRRGSERTNVGLLEFSRS